MKKIRTLIFALLYALLGAGTLYAQQPDKDLNRLIVFLSVPENQGVIQDVYQSVVEYEELFEESVHLSSLIESCQGISDVSDRIEFKSKVSPYFGFFSSLGTVWLFVKAMNSKIIPVNKFTMGLGLASALSAGATSASISSNHADKFASLHKANLSFADKHRKLSQWSSLRQSAFIFLNVLKIKGYSFADIAKQPNFIKESFMDWHEDFNTELEKIVHIYKCSK